MTIGSFGGIVFSVSPKKIKTLRDLSRNGSADIQTHKRHLDVDLPEFVGRGLESISFNIRLSKYLGVSNPQSDLNKIISYEQNGTPKSLILGTTKFGSNKWLISKHKVTYEHYDESGNPVTFDVSLTLTEYPKR